MTTAAVILEGATKRYGPLTALNGLDLTLRPGEVLGLLGHNGAGKTTTMKLILGLIRPDAGRVQVFGASPGGRDAHALRRRLGYLPENVSFYEQLSGREVLSYFARLKGASARQVDGLLARVGLAPEAAARRVKTYSKGMRQRLGLAQALLGQPRLLLLDEPTVGLDPMATRDFYRLVDELRADGAAIVLCSHVLSGVERHIDRALILSRGRPLALGTLAELRQQASLPVKLTVSGPLEQASLAEVEERGVLIERLGNERFAFTVAESGKLELLRSLLGEAALSDLDLAVPSLETLYAHFDQRSHEVEPA